MPSRVTSSGKGCVVEEVGVAEADLIREEMGQITWGLADHGRECLYIKANGKHGML